MSLEIIKMNASRREESGKGPSNRLRREGKIPAIAYGKELKATQVAVSPKALLVVLKSDHGQNSVVELDIDGGDKLTVMVRDYDYHPITRELTHADFVQVKLDQPVDVEVPFRMIGKAKGIAEGGILQQVFRKIPVRCLPEKIPALLEIDVTDIGLNESAKASAIKLPDGVKVRLGDDQTVAVVTAPERVTEEEAKPAAAAAGAAPAAGAAAAPAAGGKAPAAGKAAAAKAPEKADKKK